MTELCHLAAAVNSSQLPHARVSLPEGCTSVSRSPSMLEVSGSRHRMMHCEAVPLAQGRESSYSRMTYGAGKLVLGTEFFSGSSQSQKNSGFSQELSPSTQFTERRCIGLSKMPSNSYAISIASVRDGACQQQPVSSSAFCPGLSSRRAKAWVPGALSRLSSVEPLEEGDRTGTDSKWLSRLQPSSSPSKPRKDALMSIHTLHESQAISNDRVSGESLARLGRNVEAEYDGYSASRYPADKQSKSAQRHDQGSRAGNFPSKGNHSKRPLQDFGKKDKDLRRSEPSSSGREDILGSNATARDSPTSSTTPDAIGRLHQQLDTHSDGFLGLAQSALSKEEAEALRGKLREQREKGLQAIREKLRSQGFAKGDDGETFFHGVDPDTLVPEEYVVHKKVGVARFIGMKYELPEGKSKMAKYIYLQYADGKAKVRAKQAHKLLYRYNLPTEIGRPPPLSKLNDTSLWEKRKMKGKMAIQKMVVNMMELYVYRLKQKRTPYPKLASAMVQFAGQFLYRATPDQERAFKDVERDMTEQETPMDRLICGDVGFGKTEVALRAVFRAVAAGRQAMVMAPTTVLAKQHFAVMKDRFSTYPQVEIALLTRFQKESEKKEVLAKIRDGSLKVVVGTHSLLGNNVRYNNLGLLIVDEEQRFGVRQKEKITSLKTTVDVLTLSATPIPRTLYLALSGFKDASLITTPPPERRPIVTHLVQYNEELVKKAVDFELARNGQVFYVVPRVKDIEQTRSQLERMFPDIMVAVAHGQQTAAHLEDAMERFADGESKILLCTTIIESGLDIRDVNTIIIEDVHLFGLSQLYQLRGRVGRADREAHAYLLHPQKELLSDEAIERLVAVEECCELGQGFQLAERDMAIRGIGSIFGEKQSGDVAKIGVDLYLEMLFEGLAKIDNHQLPRVEYDAVQLDIEATGHIPGDYIPTNMREKIVQEGEKAARDGVRHLMVFTNRLRDEYGKEPASTEVFLKALYIRRLAADLGIHRIRSRGKSILMETTMELGAFEMLLNAVERESLRSSLTFDGGLIELQGLIGLPVERQMERILSCLVELRHGLPVFLRHA